MTDRSTIGSEQEDYSNPMVPELVVTDLSVSIEFYLLMGFSVKYERNENRFAFLELGRVHLMLEEMHADSWLTSRLEKPFGRGINFQIKVNDLDELVGTIKKSNWAFFRGTEERWYRAGSVEKGQRQFLIQDPDGYLLRFVESIGARPVEA